MILECKKRLTNLFCVKLYVAITVTLKKMKKETFYSSNNIKVLT